jgi:hypothetical protein
VSGQEQIIYTYMTCTFSVTYHESITYEKAYTGTRYFNLIRLRGAHGLFYKSHIV